GHELIETQRHRIGHRRFYVPVNSGQVVVRSIGSDLRMDYTAVGQTTHLAARLEQHAPANSIWLTAGTLHLASRGSSTPSRVVRCRSRASVSDVASTRSADDADGYYRQALALGEPSGMRPLVAHCHFGLGKTHRRTANYGRGRQELTIAMAMYREMEMPFW